MSQKRLTPLAVVLLALSLALAFTSPAAAQYGARAMVAPGDVVPAKLLVEQGGPVGKSLAPSLGVRPIVGVYWRPGDALSEMALQEVVELASRVAPQALLAPIAVVAAGQSPADVADRLTANGIQGVTALQDGGQLARVLGVREIPSLLLFDAGGVLRLVGGSSIAQSAEGTPTVGEAIALAAAGKPVPTLGRLPANPIFKMLGKQFPEMTLTGADGKPVKVSSALAAGKRLLVFFWLPTCGHCKRELPRLRDWLEQKKPQDLVVIDIVQATTASLQQQARSVIEPYPWQHFQDIDRSAGRALLVRDTPSAFLVAPDGEILGIKVGAGVDWEGWLGR